MLRTARISERLLPLPTTSVAPTRRFGRLRVGFRRSAPMTSYCGMIPLVAFFFFCLANTWMPPYSDPDAVIRFIRSFSAREPGLRSNVCGLETTYGDRFARLLMATPPVARFWLHGRIVTVTRSVSLVVFLTVYEPTVPRLAVASTRAG